MEGCIGPLLGIAKRGKETTYGKHGGLRTFSMFEKLFMVIWDIDNGMWRVVDVLHQIGGPIHENP